MPGGSVCGMRTTWIMHCPQSSQAHVAADRCLSRGALDDESVQDWDQFVLRFTKLQDAIGNRLFPSLLDYLLEPSAEQPMIDKLALVM
jgi:hypothetical protein